MKGEACIEDLIQTHPVVFFSKSDCPYCVTLQNDLVNMQIPYEKIMLTSNLRESLIELTGCKTVPQLFIGGKFVGGYKEFSTLCGTGKIEQLLSHYGITCVIDF